MSSRPGAGGRRRLLIALGLAVVVAYLGYLGAANWFLASETGDRVINRNPEKLRIEWSRARTWFPGVVVLDDVSIAGANRALDWTASLDHARVVLSLWRLPLKTFHSERIVGRGLVFRLRQHDEGVEVVGTQGEAPLAAAAPMVATPMAATPAPVTPAPVTPDPSPSDPAPQSEPGSTRRKPWHLELDGIEISDLREISIGRSSLIGRGEIAGGLELTVRGPLQFDVLTMAFADATLWRAGETVGENVTFTVAATTSPFEPGKDSVREILGGVSGSATVAADVESIAALDFLLKKPDWLSLSGSGHLESEFELHDGVVEPGGRLDFAAETLAARIADWTVDGGGGIALHLPEDGPAAVVDVDFEQFAIRRGEREVAHIHGEGLRVALEARAFDLERGLEDLHLRVDVPPSRVDFAAYNTYLPKSPFHIESGRGTLATWFEYSEDDAAARGEVDLSVEGASAIAGSLGVGGDLRLHTAIHSGDLETMRFDVSGSSLELRNVRITKRSGEVESEGWWATFATGKARLDMKEPLEAEVALNGRMRDAKPFLVALAAQKKMLFWVDDLLNAKDIEARALIDVDGRAIAARDLAITGRKLVIEGDVAVEGKATRDALLYIELGPFSTGLEITGGESEWKLFRARRWFEMRRSERRPVSERAAD